MPGPSRSRNSCDSAVCDGPRMALVSRGRRMPQDHMEEHSKAGDIFGGALRKLFGRYQWQAINCLLLVFRVALAREARVG
jgi:hypothetical protein